MENKNSRSKQKHDPENSEGDAMMKDSTKANLAYSIVLLIVQLRVKLRLYNGLQFWLGE